MWNIHLSRPGRRWTDKTPGDYSQDADPGGFRIMEGLIKIALVFTFISLVTALFYLKQNKKRRSYSLSLDVPSMLVYVLIAGFLLISYYYYFARV